jgi:hypothetical protein
VLPTSSFRVKDILPSCSEYSAGLLTAFGSLWGLSQLKGASLPILFGWPTSNDRLEEEYKDPATSPYLGMTLEGHLIPESPEGLAEAFAGPELLPWHVSLVLLQWQS